MSEKGTLPLRKNQTVRAEITGYTSEGLGVARVGGMAVFAPAAARGDLCELHITKVLSRYAFARVARVIEPSAARIEPACPAFPKCGGCQFWHISYTEELSLKRRRVLDALLRIGGVSLAGVQEGGRTGEDAVDIVGSERIQGYRNKAQYPVAQAGRTVFGFYQGRSHTIVPVEQCLLQSESANHLARTVCRWADEYGVPAYDERTQAGWLRHIYVRSGESGVQLCLVATSRTSPALEGGGLERLVKCAREACPQLCGIVLNVNPEDTNRILGRECVTLWGEARLEDVTLGNRFALSPLSFYQVNHEQAERLYQTALDYAALDQTQTALDLYCGIGTITQALAGECKRAVGVEVVPAAIADARRAAAQNGVENVTFVCADAGEAANRLAQEGFAPDVIVCDPPRRGMDDRAVETVLRMAPKRMVYISCNPETLARDVKKLTGKYLLRKLRVFDLFPRTANVETAAMLEQIER